MEQGVFHGKHVGRGGGILHGDGFAIGFTPWGFAVSVGDGVRGDACIYDTVGHFGFVFAAQVSHSYLAGDG